MVGKKVVVYLGLILSSALFIGASYSQEATTNPNAMTSIGSEKSLAACDSLKEANEKELRDSALIKLSLLCNDANNPVTENDARLNGVDRNSVSNREIAIIVTNFLLDDTSVPDSDGDALPDDEDNCTLVANPTQLDIDSDGIGNICDPDFNNDCTVDFSDFSELTRNLKEVGETEWDMNGDGVVDFLDISLFRDSFLASPGPSGVSNLCDEP